MLDVALSFALQPSVLLLDEPTSGVSVDDKFGVMDTLMQVVKASGVTAVFVEHDMDVVARYADRVVVFAEGAILARPAERHLRQPGGSAARRALDRVLRDEVHHRDFGWSLLEWLLATQPTLRPLVERELPAQLAELRAIYAPADAPSTPCTAGERAWGLMPLPMYGDILAATLDCDFVPRFAKLGLDARAAWLVRA